MVARDVWNHHETVADGTYAPLSRPLFIYVNNKELERPEVYDFIAFYLSNAEQIGRRSWVCQRHRRNLCGGSQTIERHEKVRYGETVLQKSDWLGRWNRPCPSQLFT